MRDYMLYKYEGSPQGFLEKMKKSDKTESPADKVSAVLAAKLLERIDSM